MGSTPKDLRTRDEQQTVATRRVPLAALRTDGTQIRCSRDEEALKRYVEAYEEGHPMPPLVAFFDGSSYWLADGHHRLEALNQSEGVDDIAEVEVHEGGRREAILYACGANATHGLPRRRDDKRHAVETLLRDKEWGKWADRDIARRCAVSHPFVSKVRDELRDELDGNVSSDRRRCKTKHGTETTMNITSIAQRGRSSRSSATAVDPVPPAPPAEPTPQAVESELRTASRAAPDPSADARQPHEIVVPLHAMNDQEWKIIVSAHDVHQLLRARDGGYLRIEPDFREGRRRCATISWDAAPKDAASD